MHHVTCTLGLLSHVAPCIKTEDGLKQVKSLVLMIESTLPQLLDGFANINIPACLIQYHYYPLLISCCQKVTLQLQPTINYCFSFLLQMFTLYYIIYNIYNISIYKEISQGQSACKMHALLANISWT